MGGFGSGRQHGKFVVEDCVGLPLNFLLREAELKQNAEAHGCLTYASGLRLHFDMKLDDETGWLELTYEITAGASAHRVEMFRIALIATERRPFGGLRWWFICPRTGKKVTKLFLPPGAIHFASREGHKLGYRSQRLSKEDQALRRARRLRARLGDTGSKGSVILKPKWQRWHTFEKQMQAICDAERKHTQLWLTQMETTRIGCVLLDKVNRPGFTGGHLV